jgi:hypothetical protein
MNATVIATVVSTLNMYWVRTFNSNVMQMGHAMHAEQRNRHTQDNLITCVDHVRISVLAAREPCVVMCATNAKQRL